MRAIATPLAAKFTHFVHNLGGYVSFITNRDATSKKVIEATVRNLEKEHIYFDQVVFSNVEAKNPSDKNSRFEAVESGKYGDDIVLAGKLPAHKILAYLGDNIQDFPNLNQKDMAKAKDTAFEDFGNRYFIMPNPIYGSWS